MSSFSPAEIVRRILDEPLVRPAHLQWRRRQFLSKDGHGSHFGVFDDFKAARAWLPRSPAFDQAALAAEYVDVRSKKVFSYDYPVMWWLDRALRDGATSVLDIGGSVGVHYYAYRRYFDMPNLVTWRVVEVPAIVSIGQDLATQNGATVLSFTEDLHQSVGTASYDIWISAGAIHYLEEGRPDQLIKRCARRPRHILLNKLPLYSGEDFVTVQNIGEGAFAPLHVYNRARLIQDIKALGYTLWDKWAVQERAMDLPGYPERSFPSFTGLYFVESASVSEKSKPLLS
ncbi:methyltransferase, TIGR04325 family [Variovorax sp. RT4R15]|uniref:methyltransferase, TIGR04325 family n=1 Tax=Variovorax sp. RT4R15 TaxID=3443737 RepID=UPI003F48EFEB